MRRNNSIRDYIFFFLVFISVIMTNPVNAKEPPALQVTSSFLLETERQAAIDPFAITQTSNGEFIVAGYISATQQAWAAKIGQEGKILWNYTLDFLDEDKAKFSHKVGFHPEFRSIASMRNGDIYLFGGMPHASKYTPTSLLVHLDATGKLLKQSFIAGPTVESKAGRISLSYYFEDCIEWDNGIAAIARATYFPKTIDGSVSHPNSLYWLVILDNDGNVKWQKQIPTLTKDFSLFSGEISLTKMKQNLVIVGNDGTNTEITILDPSGEIKARKKLEGRFILIRGGEEEDTLQFFGPSATNINLPREIYFLNENLEKIRHIQSNHLTNFVPRRAYRGINQSLVIFGSTVQLPGLRHISTVVSLDPLLKTEYSWSFEDKKYLDAGHVKTAIPTKEPGEFVMVRTLIDRGSNLNGQDVLPGFKRGGILNFIQQK